MPTIYNLMARDALDVVGGDDAPDGGSNNSVQNILVALLCLVFISLILAGVLLVLRKLKIQKKLLAQNTPPQYNDVVQQSGRSNHRRLTIETRNGHSSVMIMGRNGQPMLANPNQPPHSPDNVPEIHITFPEEEDNNGRRKSGRVLVVRVGENATVGMEPLDEEQLPAYEKESGSQFYSIDMDHIGGLREKEREDYR